MLYIGSDMTSYMHRNGEEIKKKSPNQTNSSCPNQSQTHVGSELSGNYKNLVSVFSIKTFPKLIILLSTHLKGFKKKLESEGRLQIELGNETRTKMQILLCPGYPRPNKGILVLTSVKGCGGQIKRQMLILPPLSDGTTDSININSSNPHN